MENVKAFSKKYGIYVLVGLVGIWILLKYGKASGGNSQVVNRVLPVDTNASGNALGMAQLQAQYGLGKLQLENQSAIAEKQIAAEKQRLDYANQALTIQGNYGLKALEIEAQKVQGQNDLQANLARVALDQQSYDTQTRINAATELQRQAANQSYLNQLLGIGNGILQALLKPQQSRGGASGGGSSSPSGMSGINPNQAAINAARQRQNALAAIGNWITRNSGYNQPLQLQSYPSLGNAQGYDTSSLDYYINYLEGLGVNEPTGSVTSSFEYLPFSGGIDWNSFAVGQGYEDFNAYYNDQFGF